MLKKSRCLVLVMILILAIVSCSTFAARKPIKLIYGHVFSKSHFLYKGDLYFKELVEKKSKGKIIVEIYPAGQLGNLNEMYQAVKLGSQHLVIADGGGLSTYWIKLGTLDLPYLYRNIEHFIKVAGKITSMIDQDQMAAQTGMRILGARIQTPRQLTTKFPVNKIEDIKGLKMRVPENQIYLAFWRAVGTIPMVVPGGEIYTALATGVIDAQENPLASFYEGRNYEHTKYCALTSHVYQMLLMVVNNNWWNNLTATQKKLVKNALDESNKLMVKAALDSEKESKELLSKAGVTFTTPDLVSFREKAKTIWRKFGDQDLIEKIQSVK
jgi:tripartite ATP-independent transporter DctP family solute receptor